jgi:VWFA-related protein
VRLLGGLVLALLTAPAGVTQTPAASPTLVIDEPAPGSYVSGLVTLSAGLQPAGQALMRLTFAVDGQLVCAREAPPWECVWDAGSDVSSHNIRAVALLRDGLRLVDSVRTEGGGFAPAVVVEVVQVAATVTDEDGELVKGLPRDAFRIFEDGEPQELTHFIGQDTERELVVAVDMSASMAPVMATCREAVKRFLASLRPMDRVTLLAFNDSVFTVARREVPSEARMRTVDRLRAWGSTSFYDAALKGLDLLEEHRGRRALVLFTDGEDMVSYATIEDVQRRIERSATPVYVIAQGRGMREATLKKGLDRIAGVSGGRSFYTDTIEELDGVFSEIAEDLASQYLLAYAPTRMADDGSWRTIRVEVAGRRYTVRARQGYRARTQGR